MINLNRHPEKVCAVVKVLRFCSLFVLLFKFYLAVPVCCCFTQFSYQSLVFRYAGLRWQSAHKRGGGCHLSVKAAPPSSRPGVLGQLASELASVTVEEWTLNNRARSSALPPGRMAGWLAGVTRQDGGQSQATIHYFYLRKGGGVELRARAPFSALSCMLIPAALRKGTEICWLRYVASPLTKGRKENPSCLMPQQQTVCTHMHINMQLHAGSVHDAPQVGRPVLLQDVLLIVVKK